MRIKLTSVSIDDYDKALSFYTEKLGFEKKIDMALPNGDRWITVVSPADPNGTELLLEPNAEYPAMKQLKESLTRDGIPFTAFEVDDVHGEYERLKNMDVEFTVEPTDAGEVTVAVLDDTCGNLIQIYQTN
ncbi:MAG: VOC family protein [Chloroflexota bacterium]